MHTLELKYEQVGKKYFPIINVELLYGINSIITKAYVDSGATYSIFHQDLAKILGVDYKKGKKIYPIGLGGHICAYVNRIRIKIENVEILCDVLFSDELTVRFNLLGRIGLFDRFKICFDDTEKVLTLTIKKK